MVAPTSPGLPIVAPVDLTGATFIGTLSIAGNSKVARTAEPPVPLKSNY